MAITTHHAKYFAHDLIRRGSAGVDRLSMSMFDASVDLNPHQIEAALFALQSPLTKSVILADDVMPLMWRISKPAMIEHHVLFQEEDKDSYIGKFFDLALNPKESGVLS